MKLYVDCYIYQVIFSLFASALKFFLTPVLHRNVLERFSHLDLGVCESPRGTASEDSVRVRARVTLLLYPALV